MNCLSRREFIIQSATAAGALSLGADRLPALEPAKPAEMAVARWTGRKQLPAAELQKAAVRLTERAVAAMGGMGRFVSRGSVVWVKPNMAWDRTPEQAANTNPDVVATLVRLCLEAGAKTVKVGDNPCHAAPQVYQRSGIAAAAKAAGAEVVFLDRSRFRDMTIGGERVKTLPVFPGVVECDLVINVPVVKHHSLAQLTMCMKNYMGVIEKRNTLHQDIPTSLADLTRFMKPRITVLDCVRVLTAHGPTGGDLADVQTKLTVAAGIDPVALDAFGAELMGKRPADIGSVAKGHAAGLGTMDYRKLSLKEVAVA